LQLIGQHFERGDGAPVLRDDVLPVPGSAGELKEVVAGVGRSVHGRQQVGAGLHALRGQTNRRAVCKKKEELQRTRHGQSKSSHIRTTWLVADKFPLSGNQMSPSQVQKLEIKLPRYALYASQAQIWLGEEGFSGKEMGNLMTFDLFFPLRVKSRVDVACHNFSSCSRKRLLKNLLTLLPP